MGDDQEPFDIELEPLPDQTFAAHGRTASEPDDRAAPRREDPDAPSRAMPHPKYPEVIIEPPVAQEDEQIYCPVCSYNLTGIHSGRCPECGSLFDRDALIAAQQANQITLIPWDDPEQMPLRKRLVRTLRVCLFNAERFAFAFSVQPQETRATGFLVGVTSLCALIAVLATLLYDVGARLHSVGFGRLPDTLTCVCSVLVFVPLAIPTSTALAALFLWAYSPHYDGRHHFKPWWSIAAYGAAHYLMIALAMIIFPLVASFGEWPSEGELVFTAFWIWMGCTALCVLTLRAVIFLRTTDSDYGFAILCVLGIYGGCSIAFMFIAGLIGEELARIIRICF
jgi:hypothetical protein